MKMRKLLFCLLLSAPTILLGQITLEHSFDVDTIYASRVDQFTMENGNSVFVRTTALEPSNLGSPVPVNFTFYDHNYIEFSSINTEAVWVVSPNFVSTNLFNTDDEIEFLIHSTNGIQILSISGNIIWDSECNAASIYNTDEGAKMLARCPESATSRVYSLPGSLPSGLAENGNGELLAYPNPTKSFINIPTEGASQIEVYNTMGQKVFEMPVNGTSFQQVPTSQLAPGTYIYQTTSEQEVKPGKMFVVE